MSLTREEIAFATELFSGLGDITTRRMMGGLCLYHGGTIFALVHGDGSIWLKGVGGFVAKLEVEGLQPLVSIPATMANRLRCPTGRCPTRRATIPDLACDWARRALAHL